MIKKTTGWLGFILILLIALTLLYGNGELLAQTPQSEKKDTDTKKSTKNNTDSKTEPKQNKEPDKVLHYEVTVTATRTKKDTFETPKPVSVINRQMIQELAPNNITEMLVDLPGVDVNGVGANQSRPVIRGFRGQRILLMEDGIRMNSSRRQQDFGEIPGLVDVAEIDRVEVVRGPASVLYGSDAIGGVVNIITRIPDLNTSKTSIHGNLGYRYSSADKQNKAMANMNGNLGKFAFTFSGNYRNAKDYTAPAGSFGNIHLQNDVIVNDTGVKDGGANLLLCYNFTGNTQLSLKYEYYNAQDAGFGFVEPELYDPGSPRIRISYPDQTVNKYTFKYEHRKMDFLLADHVSLIGYFLSNERHLAMDIFIPFNIPNRPTAGLKMDSTNYTDIDTLGFRFELDKAIGTHVLTYGVDFFKDVTDNTDSTTNTVLGFGPPRPVTDTTPQVPNASYGSLGVFVQDDISLFKRTSVILGMRYQNVNAKTKETIGLVGLPLVDSTDQTVVGAANFIYGISDSLRLVLAVGRGFRSPNLIERFFNGTTPEGSGFQSRNPNLKAETSLNLDIGLKYRYKSVYLESTFFNNVIYDGIRIHATGETINNLPEWQNINVDKLRMSGVEVLGKILFNFGVSAMANFTYIKSKDLGNPETPYVDTYSSKLNINLRYDNPSRLYYVSYDFRLNGDQKDIDLGVNPVGSTIPGFTTHTLSAGITLFKKSKFPQQLGIIVGNIGNTLYSEFSNASFFRPAPKRHIILTWNASF